MQKLITRLEGIPIGVSVVKKAMPAYCKLVFYDALPKTLHALFGNKRCVIIFYQIHTRTGKVEEKTGHFSLLMKRKNGLNFYSSYGLRPEEEIHKTHSKGMLLKLLGKNYSWNRRQYQSVKRVQTCALHCIVRAYFMDLNTVQYSKMMSRFIAKNADDLVSIMTLCLIKT